MYTNKANHSRLPNTLRLLKRSFIIQIITELMTFLKLIRFNLLCTFFIVYN